MTKTTVAPFYLEHAVYKLTDYQTAHQHNILNKIGVNMSP